MALSGADDIRKEIDRNNGRVNLSVPIVETKVSAATGGGNTIKIIKTAISFIFKFENGNFKISSPNGLNYSKFDENNSKSLFAKNTREQQKPRWLNFVSNNNDGYRDLKDDAFLKMYGYDEYSITRIGTDGNPKVEKHRMLPCHNCGFLFSKENIQMDHRHPKSTPEAEGATLAFVKALRWAGLTEQSATGKKHSYVSASFGSTPTAIPPQNNSPGVFKTAASGLVETSDNNKWLLNHKGKFYLSLWLVIDDDIRRFFKAPDSGAGELQLKHDPERSPNLDTKMNMVPLCPTCNVKKGANFKHMK